MLDRAIFRRQTQFSKTERAALRAMRIQYLTTCHGFTDRELAHLLFIRWLVRRSAWNQALDLPASAVPA